MASNWAEDLSDEDPNREEEFKEEHVITSLPKIDSPRAAKKVKKAKKKRDPEERPPEPKVSTKIVETGTQQVVKTREDGSTLSKKEIAAQELDELDAILGEFGVETTASTGEQPSQPEERKQDNSKKHKNSKKTAFANVRAEVNARQSGQKKQKKQKNQDHHFK